MTDVERMREVAASLADAHAVRLRTQADEAQAQGVGLMVNIINREIGACENLARRIREIDPALLAEHPERLYGCLLNYGDMLHAMVPR